MSPFSGSVETRGKVASLLELGAGFHPELTGRENIFLNAAIMGLSQKQINERFDSLVQFSQLEDFIDIPLYTYSSGMYVRLGFAIAIFTDFDILVIDEILAVGDVGFQKKCIERIMGFKKAGKTIVFVTHDLGLARMISDRILWLEKGELKTIKEKKAQINSFYKMIHKESKGGRIDQVKNITQEQTARDVIITDVIITNKRGRQQKVFSMGDKLIVDIQFMANSKIKNPVFGVAVYSADDDYLIGPNTKFNDIKISEIDGRGSVKYIIESLPFLTGRYFVSVSITNDRFDRTYDYHDRRYCFRVRAPFKAVFGSLYTEGRWDIRKINN
jgi:lipopolysaccharide transport system ATP-binding protein